MLGLDDYKNSTSPSISSPESHNSDSSVEVSERRGSFVSHPGHPSTGFRPLHSHLPPTVADLSALSKEMMNLPLGFHLSGMSLLPPAFLPPPSLTMFSPYHLYSSHHQPLLNHHTSSNALRHSPEVKTDKDPCKNNNNNVNNNNNDRYTHNHNVLRNDTSPTIEMEHYSKRYYLDAVLKSQRNVNNSPTKTISSIKSNSELESSPIDPGSRVYCNRADRNRIKHEDDEDEDEIDADTEIEEEYDRDNNYQDDEMEENDQDLKHPPPQDNPMDLSMKSLGSQSISTRDTKDDDDEIDPDSDRGSPPPKRRPIDLTTRF